VAARLDTAAETAVVILARTGDAAAFRELVRRREVRVRDLLRRLCGNHALGDDLAQETFVQAWTALGSLRNPGGFGAWLRQIAVNVWRQEARRRRLILADDEEISGEPDPRPAAAADDRLDLITALATLRPVERLCVVLFFAEGMTHGEIVEAAGLPLGTVKSYVRRGGDKLKAILAIGDG
jgi:RNA polymerase sigma-70 factor, ECF subfamily